MSFLVDRILTSGGNRDSFLQKEHDIECEKMHGHSEDTIVDDFGIILKGKKEANHSV